MADTVSKTVNTQIRKLLSDGTYQVEHPETTIENVLGKATKSEAEGGTNNSKYITPLRLKQAVDKAIDETISKTLDDPSGSPGRSVLYAGTLAEGYFGFVPASELVTGVKLASLVGLSEGISQFSDEGWYKYAYKDKICFVAKKPLRHSISWDTIDKRGAVFGTREITIGGLTYKVRLMTGGDADPASERGGEWSEIMYAGLAFDWGPYTEEDLLTNRKYGFGAASWCQETDKENSLCRVFRGRYGTRDYGTYLSDYDRDSDYGWRPVLELVQ